MRLTITLAFALLPLPTLSAQTWTPAIFTPSSHARTAALAPVTGGVRISISTQGDEVLKANGGNAAKDIRIGSVDVCNDSPAATRGIDVGNAYSAIRSMEVATLGPGEADLVLDRAVATSKAQTAMDVGAAVGAGAALGASVSGISQKWKIGLAALPVGIEFARVYFMRRLPSDTNTKVNLLRSTGSKPVDWLLPPGSCIPDGRVFLYRFHAEWNTKEVILP